MISSQTKDVEAARAFGAQRYVREPVNHVIDAWWRS